MSAVFDIAAMVFSFIPIGDLFKGSTIEVTPEYGQYAVSSAVWCGDYDFIRGASGSSPDMVFKLEKADRRRLSKLVDKA